MDENPDNGSVVRISLLWLAAGLIVVLVIGMLGGLLASYFWPQRSVPLTQDQNQLITTVQEVTISPNTAAADIVAGVDRSVVTIVRESQPTLPAATGTVVTNDGLVVVPSPLPDGPLAALDFRGTRIPLERVGNDALFGITYLRLREGVLSPLDVRSEDVPVGYELLLVGRAAATSLPHAQSFMVSEHILPPELLPIGLQQLYKGSAIDEAAFTGSPVVDDERRLAGIVLNPAAGLVLPAQELRASLQRLTDGRREFAPFAEFGFQVRYVLLAEGEERQFAAEVESVTGQSVAAAAGLQRGDFIVGVGESNLSWRESFAGQLAEELPLTLQVRRGSRDAAVTLIAPEEE